MHMNTYRRSLTVAVDVDGPLYELVPALRTWLHHNAGLPMSQMPDPTIYDIAGVWGITQRFLIEQLIAGCQAGHLFWKGEAHRPGIKALHALRAAGHRIVLVTARDLPGIEATARAATETWARAVDAPYDELFLTHDKNTVDWDVLVDDYEVNVTRAHADQRHALLLRREWNLHLPLATHDWADVLTEVDSLACSPQAA